MTTDKFTEIKFNYKHSDLMVKFNSIHIDPKNPRIGTNPKDDQSLQESVLENGLNMQIVIAKTDKKGEYIIVFGHRRYDIFVEAGYKNTNPLIPCTVIMPFDEPDRPLTDDEIFDYRNADENYQSKLSFHERIVNIFQKTEEKLEEGMNVQQIAEKVFHKKDPWLRNNLNAFRNPTIRKAIEDGEVTSMHQAWNLLGIDAEAQETLIDAKKDIKATGMEKAAKLVREGKETASAIESVKHPEDERTLIIRTAPEDAQERLLDATKDMDLHDTERVVKQVIMGVRIDEAIRAVKLSRTPEIQVKDAEVKERFAETGEDPQLPPVDDHPPSASKTVNDGEGETIEEAVEKDDDSGREPLQPPSPETTGIVAETLGLTTDKDKDKEPEPPEEEATEDEDKDKKPSTEPKVIKFVNRMLRLGEATKSHMKEKELESLADANYRKLLKDYEEASFSIETFRDFLQGRENNGSVQFNRAKRLHNAIREFDAHSISSVKEATDLRSIKIQTKKKLTEDVNIFDNIINAKKPASQEGV